MHQKYDNGNLTLPKIQKFTSEPDLSKIIEISFDISKILNINNLIMVNKKKLADNRIIFNICQKDFKVRGLARHQFFCKKKLKLSYYIILLNIIFINIKFKFFFIISN